MTNGARGLLVEAPGRAGPADGDAALFRSFFERSGLRVARIDADLRIAAANAEFERAFGDRRRALAGTRVLDLLHPDHRGQVQARLAALLQRRAGRVVDERIVARGGGRMFACRMTALLVPDGPEPPEGVLVILEPDGADAREAPRRHVVLSDVDAHILEGIGVGVSTMQLAASLMLSRGGVEYHVKSLMQRFKVRNRPALISKAYSTGVFRVGHWPPRVCRTHVR